ncbi:MAG: hypothetical protein Q9219_002649 [cf. Caloplaca sp. 3 TL-2023]
MHMSVDGACRYNGYSNATAAAAVVVFPKWGRNKIYTRRLPDYPTPTNQAAELTAIILALEQAVEKYEQLSALPYMRVTIRTDSKYAFGCMTEWVHKWRGNGWINCAGRDVANRDLIEEALDLEAEIERNGNVSYVWVPREENQEADEAANDALDESESETDSDEW